MSNHSGLNDPWAKHQMVINPEQFHNFYRYTGAINRGSDGVVSKYQHRRIPTRVVAVKTTFEAAGSRGHRHQATALQTEIALLRKLSSANIVSLLGCEESWNRTANNPAAYYEYCELGDLQDYQEKLLESYRYVPEETVWKYFADMSRGFYHLHHEQNPPLVHGDFKPGNVLVQRPRVGNPDDTLPLLPVFKIADFGRCREYNPRHQRTDKNRWWGTYEFAPPLAETEATPATPAMDIFSLGATIQAFALNRTPVQSRAAFMADWLKKTGVDLAIADPPICWKDQEWRARIPLKLRPLNVAATRMRAHWDWPADREDPPQFSNQLNRWYLLCWTQDPEKRVTAKYLFKFVVPQADKMIAVMTKAYQMSNVEEELKDAKEEMREFLVDVQSYLNEEEGVEPPQREREDSGQAASQSPSPPPIPPKAPGRYTQPPPPIPPKSPLRMRQNTPRPPLAPPPVPPRPKREPRWWEIDLDSDKSACSIPGTPNSSQVNTEPLRASRVPQLARVYENKATWSKKLRTPTTPRPQRQYQPQQAPARTGVTRGAYERWQEYQLRNPPQLPGQPRTPTPRAAAAIQAWKESWEFPPDRKRPPEDVKFDFLKGKPK